MTQKDMNQQQLDALLDAVYQHHGYDFRHYSRDYIWRRVIRRMKVEQLDSIADLQQRVLTDENSADALLRTLSINVTEMFRDPAFFLELRRQAVPSLAHEPHIKIWHAGCASGEEVFSMAILLKEEALYERSLLYATDFNNKILHQARKAILPLDQMRQNSSNYYQAGGKHSLADYYHCNYDAAVLDKRLLNNISFFHHNLTLDEPLPEVQMIICRNVLIYFERELQQRVFELFCQSLEVGGLLCLGSHESLKLDATHAEFEVLSAEQRIFRRIT